MKGRPYQCVWRHGQLIQKGRRDCGARYRAILRKVVAPRWGPPPLKPGVTVLDVGAWDGYFSRRLHEEGASCTMVDQRPEPDLRGYPSIRYLQRTMDARLATELGHHHLTLALSVFHHMPDWVQVYRGLLERTDVMVVEVAHPDEVGEGRTLTPTLKATRPHIRPVYEEFTRAGRLIATTTGPNGVDRPLLELRP